jgi:hypothetical protein
MITTSNVVTPFGFRETYFKGDLPTDYAVKSKQIEGLALAMEDLAPRTTPAGTSEKRSAAMRTVICVRNAGATALSAGDAVKWSAGYIGKRVTKNDATAGPIAGIVIDCLIGTCIQYDLCWIVFDGPCVATKAASDGGIAEGDAVLSTNAGKVGPPGVTPSADTATGALADAINHAGYCQTAALTTDTSVLIWVRGTLAL